MYDDFLKTIPVSVCRVGAQHIQYMRPLARKCGAERGPMLMMRVSVSDIHASMHSADGSLNL